jgi:hypothetical protein
VFGLGLLVNAHDLRRARRVDGADFARGLNALATDDEVVLAAELRAHLAERFAHGAGNVRLLEISEWLVGKRAQWRARLN